MSDSVPPSTAPLQRVVKVRRDYNTWVANETIEDYALRFTPRSFRKWSEFRVANMAFGDAAFLVLEAVGATLLVSYGFANAALAVLVTGLIIFLAGLPISYYAARYGVDMDLLTRGAGFGYIGSTLTSLIYASFTFIFFALEAAIMAYALELAFAIPPALGYLICALVVIPLATHGVTAISRLQAWTQPVWLVLMLLPYIFVLHREPTAFDGILAHGPGFDWQLFGAALTVGVALITQMGEQADYLRFMPERTAENRRRWNLAVLFGGTGWIFVGVAKMLGGMLLAYLALSHAVPAERAVDPNRMYLVGFDYVFSSPGLAIAATAIFVIVSQLKINVTNAYAGSLAWSNFFARLTHSHPGRVVWMVFNTLIALMLMEMNVFQALKQVLGLYSNVAIAWMMVVVADLVINKPLGLSPPGIEFRRAYLYDINPVGVGAMLAASALSVAAHLGLFGAWAQAFASFIAIGIALVATPLLAWATGGRYYLARPAHAHAPGTQRCAICEKDYESEDMADCPAYGGAICSLCCALDARCHHLCQPRASFAAQWGGVLRRALPRALWPHLDAGLGHYVLLMLAVVPLLGAVLGLVYLHETQADPALAATLPPLFLKLFVALLLVSGIIAWWLVLTLKSREVAQEESNRQTQLLMREIESHQRTDVALQKAKQAADLANQAKSRHVSALSHELRTPLNSILGYAQILDGDPAIPPHRRQAIAVVRRSGEHLLSLIEGTLDLARIEGGRLTLQPRPIDLGDFLQQIVRMIEVQARAKGIGFEFVADNLPAVVRADEKRLRQILINILGNAVKFTSQGEVRFTASHAREMATFQIEDTGPGIAPDELERVFEPFVRGSSAQGAAAGSGLGLTIARMLTQVMGGELTVASNTGAAGAGGVGSRFVVRLYLPALAGVVAPVSRRARRVGYAGPRRRLLIVDNEAVDRELLAGVLAPLGFVIDQAASGLECLEVLPRFRPDAILMDLAMPGMDGWETIRAIRRDRLADARIAIVSANAFDKGAENDLAIGADDFVTKPVRFDELFDWLGRALALDWIEAEENAPLPPPAGTAPRPPDAALAALRAQVDAGYMRGIQAALDALAAAHPECAEFTRRLRKLARDFRIDELAALLKS
ncbi:MAG: ATP-binding protein [Rhodocyclaceae bacterium]|jgi:signal transduction histidine kinase/purine-cytosine permease-like protein/DNA-binding NarL/FixJ family response regulator|nr:ATP-binding protein [Rhodocyclaceae bacterium]